MLSLLKHLRDRWNDWCGDRDMEIAIRRHLNQNGYFGQSARFTNVRIVAVQRPGWLQVFRFEATARLRPQQTDDGRHDDDQDNDVQDDDGFDPEPVYHQLYGLVRDDIRRQINTVRVFQDAEQRRALFVRWSEDMICLRGAYGLRSDVDSDSREA